MEIENPCLKCALSCYGFGGRVIQTRIASPCVRLYGNADANFEVRSQAGRTVLEKFNSWSGDADRDVATRFNAERPGDHSWDLKGWLTKIHGREKGNALGVTH